MADCNFFQMKSGARSEGAQKLRKVALNAAWLALGGIIAQASFVAVEALIARKLGPSTYGVFGTVYSLSVGLMFLVEAGTNWYLIEIGSKRTQEIPWLLGTSLVLRVGLFVVWYPLILVLLGPLGYSTDIVHFFALFFFYALFMVTNDTLAAVYSAQQRMHVNALFQASAPIVILALILLMPLRDWQLAGVGAAYVGGMAIVNAVWLTLVWREHMPQVRLRLSFTMLKGSFFYGLAGLIDQFTQRIDILVLSMVRPMAEVGLFVAAHRIFEVCMKVGVVAARAVIPMLFKVNVENTELYAQMCAGALRFFATAGAALGLFTALASKELMTGIFGARYASAALALQVLGCALALRFTWIGVDAVLLASSHKLKRTGSLGISVAVTGIASLLLIPRMGIPGAAIARLVGSVAQLVFSLGGANVPLSITRVVVLIGWPIAIAVGCFFVARVLPLPHLASIVAAVLLMPCALLATGYLKLAQLRGFLPVPGSRTID
jgi:O-antigen/teichoic acid export membrane protein